MASSLPEARQLAPGTGRRRIRPRPVTVVVTAGALALTGVLTWAASASHADNEARLLRLQTNQAAATLASGLPSTHDELADADQVMVDTDANPAVFRRFLGDRVGPGRAFLSASAWRLGAGGPRLVVRLGAPAELVQDGRATAFLDHLRPSATLQVTPILSAPTGPRLGFAELSPGAPGDRIAIYAEVGLPPDRRISVPKTSAFSDLNFALYLGRDEQRADLLETSVPLPITTETAVAAVPFGNTSITIVGTPTQPLAGALSQSLPWIVLGVGLALSVAFGGTVEYVARRRLEAERVAGENERLFLEEKDVTTTLQRALLPASMPRLGELEIAARYLPGVAGVEVGGDWYDVIVREEGRCFFVVGDVSGRGLRAATTMASLRFAVQAYVREGHDPKTVLTKLGAILGVEHQQFASVILGEIELRSRRVTLVSAGHLPPLLVTGAGASYAEVRVSPPIGAVVSPMVDAETASLEIAGRTTILAFTDGLVERRGEHLDVGLERLRQSALAAEESGGGIEEVLDRILADLLPEGADDDVALLGVRWPT